MDSISIHIGMILFILGVNLHDFVFLAFSSKSVISIGSSQQSSTLIPLIGNLMDLISLHIGMILYTLGLIPHGFIFEFLFLIGLIPIG